MQRARRGTAISASPKPNADRISVATKTTAKTRRVTMSIVISGLLRAH
jgi:hypothetical protein